MLLHTFKALQFIFARSYQLIIARNIQKIIFIKYLYIYVKKFVNCCILESNAATRVS